MTFSKSLHSRAHPLNYLPGWIKREDELSFGISGPKLRKLQLLIPALKKKEGVILYGSAYSNFILAAVQLLIENQIEYRLKLKMPHTPKISGNLHYLLRMVPKEKILNHLDPLPENFRTISEGGDEIECIEGSKSLAKSILENQIENQVEFSKVIIDAGTGISAIGLILGLSDLNQTLPVHVFSMKITKDQFLKKLKNHNIKTPFYFHTLTSHKSFGAVNNTLLSFINKFAQNEGIFLDPIYSGKLIFELSHHQTNILDNRSLIVHSGGALSLSGFELQSVL